MHLRKQPWVQLPAHSSPIKSPFYSNLVVPTTLSRRNWALSPALALCGDGFPPHLSPLVRFCPAAPSLLCIFANSWVGAVFVCTDSPGCSYLPLLPHVSCLVAHDLLLQLHVPGIVAHVPPVHFCHVFLAFIPSDWQVG